MVFFDSIWKYCQDTCRSTGEYIVIYQSGPIDNFTHVPGTVSQYSDESEYNVEFTSGISFARFRMLNNDFLNKYPYVVP